MPGRTPRRPACAPLRRGSPAARSGRRGRAGSGGRTVEVRLGFAVGNGGDLASHAPTVDVAVVEVVSAVLREIPASAAAAEKTLWPETYSANGGVRKEAGP